MKKINLVAVSVLMMTIFYVTILSFTSCTKLDPAPSCPSDHYCLIFFDAPYWGGGNTCYKSKSVCEEENGNECRECI